MFTFYFSDLSIVSGKWNHPEHEPEPEHDYDYYHPEPEYPKHRPPGYTTRTNGIHPTRTYTPSTTIPTAIITTPTPTTTTYTTTTTTNIITSIRPTPTFTIWPSTTSFPEWPEPDPEPESEPEDHEEIEESASTTKSCEMSCKITKLSSKAGIWKRDTFWTVINEGYTCHMQVLGKKLLDNENYCDFQIKSVNPTTNVTSHFCAHASVLSLASEKLRTEVSDAIEKHVSDPTRDRSGLPSYDWPPLSPNVVTSILQYIYTLRMTGFDAQNNIIGLYVGAFFADLRELMDMIEDYVNDSFVDQLNQLVLYLRWAHITNNDPLKESLMRIGRKIFKMDHDEFDKFIGDFCKSCNYKKELK